MNFKVFTKFFAIVFTFSMLFGTVYASTKFKDLSGYSWAESYIEELAKREIISGTSQDTFSPGNNVKREEFVKVIVNLFGYDTTNVTCNFEDVGVNDWYYPYVAAATKAGIVNGVGNNKFGTGAYITRQDICVILYRVLNDKGYTLHETKTGKMDFEDVSEISDYAKEAVENLYKAEIINGMDEKHFAPKNYANRAQMVKLAYLCDEKKTYEVQDISIQKISFTNFVLKLLTGESEKVDPVIEPSNATNVKLIWSTSNDKIATVSEDGTVTAISTGTATIKVTTEDGTQWASYIVSIEKAPIPVTDIYLDQAKIELAVGEAASLYVTIMPVDASNKKVIWSTNNESVATVKDGRVTAVAIGNATITAQAEDGGKKISCRVTVTKPVVHVEKMSLNQQNITLTAGQSTTLIPVITPVDATNKEVTWRSDNTSVATVNLAGIVNAVSPGIARITAKSKDGERGATCVVTVVSR
ncbi:MAG: Ig-like domain-containing protein [Clostridia bacterium]|nr:Ig-like domain-containing protein [Clostridia bacterium]